MDETSEKIVQATFRILQEDGVEKATTKRIAAEAGVNEVTVFRKFKNKKNLVDETKEYYINILLSKLEDIFDFDEDDEIEEYLKKNFVGFLHLSDHEFSIIKVAMEEVRDIPEKKLLLSRITETMISKLEEFFKFQMVKGKIRNLDSRVLAIMCFSMTFQSVVLWKIYNRSPSVETEQFGEHFLNILYNGIAP